MNKFAKVSLQIVGIVAILFYFTVVAIFANKDREVKCNKVVVHIQDSTDITFVNKSEIIATIKRANLFPEGKDLHKVSTKAIERQLQKSPEIKTVECYKTIGNDIRINITQRTPILRIMSMIGNYYVDNEAHIIPVSVNHTVHTPVASGFITQEFAQTELYKFALFLQNDDFWNAFIGQIYVYPNHDISIIPRVGDHEVILGDLNNYEEKLDNLLTFYHKGLNQLGWNRYEKINLKYKDQIVCTKKKK